MPNGGSDCCGTCWFNRANEGRAGYAKIPRHDAAFCEIRGVPVEDPFWTYCVNHPHHNPARVEVPVGPIFVCDDYPYTRRVLVSCPDNEAVRSKLLELLEAMPETPMPEYPSPTHFDEQVIDQLMAFRERRAVPGLRRAIGFDPDAAPPDDQFGRSRATTVGHAIEALAAIAGDEALDDIERCLASGLDGAISSTDYDPEADRRAAVRYHAVRALEHCRSGRATALLERAKDDPHPEIRAFAGEILDQAGDPSMTAQIHEELILDGEETSMAFCPPLPDRHPRIVGVDLDDATLADGPSWLFSTACWRGYQGTWEIRDGRFYLVGLRGKFKLRGDDSLLADWFSGVLRIPKGILLEYVHMGFGSVYEQEVHIKVEDGLVTSSRVIDNRGKTHDGRKLGWDNLPGGENRFPGDGEL